VITADNVKISLFGLINWCNRRLAALAWCVRRWGRTVFWAVSDVSERSLLYNWLIAGQGHSAGQGRHPRCKCTKRSQLRSPDLPLGSH